MQYAACFICRSTVGTQLQRDRQYTPDELKNASCAEYPCYPADILFQKRRGKSIFVNVRATHSSLVIAHTIALGFSFFLFLRDRLFPFSL